MSAAPLLGALAVALTLACQPSSTPEPTGRSLYVRHCAACHGNTGAGDGPVAPTLTTPPANLRTLARRRGGFDESYVMSVIDGKRQVAAHGPREMPVWGAVFEDARRGERYASLEALYHGRALTDYLRSLQEE